MDLYIPPYRINNEKIYTNKRSSIKATSNSKNRAIDIAAKCRMFTTRSLSSWVVLSSTTDLLILRHKIDYVTSLNVDFRRLYITRHRDLGTSITRIVCCFPTVGSNYCTSWLLRLKLHRVSHSYQVKCILVHF